MPALRSPLNFTGICIDQVGMRIVKVFLKGDEGVTVPANFAQALSWLLAFKVTTTSATATTTPVSAPTIAKAPSTAAASSSKSSSASKASASTKTP